MVTHDIKAYEGYWLRLESGDKKCELRVNDRDYQAGDKLMISAVDDAGNYLDRHEPIFFRITHVLSDFVGLQEGFCILSVEPTEHV